MRSRSLRAPAAAAAAAAARSVSVRAAVPGVPLVPLCVSELCLQAAPLRCEPKAALEVGGLCALSCAPPVGEVGGHFTLSPRAVPTPVPSCIAVLLHGVQKQSWGSALRDQLSPYIFDGFLEGRAQEMFLCWILGSPCVDPLVHMCTVGELTQCRELTGVARDSNKSTQQVDTCRTGAQSC